MNRQNLINEIFRLRSFLCVGLDTDIRKIPPHLLGSENPIWEFNKAIIDATAPFCIAYKPNVAFYESFGLQGWTALEKTVEYIRLNYPDKLIIADAKRGDIGNTSKMYAKTFFEEMKADALTIAPYMGEDSVSPFLGYPGKWVILLALTSNPGSADFQLTPTGEERMPLFERVMRKAMQWASPEELMFVVGATQGERFSEIRRIAPDNFLLVPGVGTQGGSLEDVCKYGMTDKCGLIVNSSRGIIYASSDKDFATRAADEARILRDRMDALLPR